MRLTTGRQRRAALAGAAAIVASSLFVFGGPVLASKPVSHATTIVPKVDIVGKGIFSCATLTGEIGYSPAISSAGNAKAHERVSIWIKATNCKALPGVRATPIPKMVVTALSYLDNFGTTCPQITSPAAGTSFGTGVMDLAYNFPPEPTTMIDPSVAPAATVGSGTPPSLWDISTTGVQDGSYISPSFKAQIKPGIIGSQSCARGITSEYISRGTLTAV